MGWKLPPLNALRAFEAAARHESFSLAADELNVTPGAISRQIKTLEIALGHNLFVRNNRDVKLTAESRVLSAALAEAFRNIDAAAGAFIETKSGNPLRVVCSMIVATRWLFPRLARFHTRYPHRHVSLTTSLASESTPFAGNTAEAIIRLGTDSWPKGIASHYLFSSELVPICSPDLLKQGLPLNGPQDLRHHTLLSSALRPQSWQRWTKSAGVEGLDLDAAIEFESSALTYTAALEGHGVALGERAFIGEDVRKGRLVVPFAFVHKNPESFFLIYKRELEGVPRLKEFASWLIQEAVESTRETDEIGGIPRS
jgi:LysR family transcriptional regulator, glycine cleavage system transcriptional activator